MTLLDNDTIKTIIIVIIVIYIYNNFISKREGYSRRFGALDGPNNMVLTDNKGNLSSIQFPKGIIVAWNGTVAPEGWTLCDGSNGSPDLRGKFILGINPNSNKNPSLSTRELRNEGGSETTQITLTAEHIPPHQHKILTNHCNGNCPSGSNTNFATYGDGDWNLNSENYKKGDLPSNKPVSGISIIPPFYTLAYIMKL